MSRSEDRFKALLERQYPNARIKKMPDFKQTGNSILKGMPDFLVMHDGKCLWFEVKMVESLKTFNFGEINDYQWIELAHMLEVGINVDVAIYNGNSDLFIYPFSKLLELRKNGDKALKLSP